MYTSAVQCTSQLRSSLCHSGWAHRALQSCLLRSLCPAHCLQVKLLLQPLKGQDASSGRQLCLLDCLATLKPLRVGINQTLLGKLAEFSDPEFTQPVQRSVPAIPASRPPAAETSTGETFTEGTQQSAQRTGRVERRHHQLRAKQRIRPEAPPNEAARARSSSCASAAFIPEGAGER